MSRMASSGILATIALLWLFTPSAAQNSNQIEVRPQLDTWVEAADPEAGHAGSSELVARFSGEMGTRILLSFDVDEISATEITGGNLEMMLRSASGPSETPMAVSALRSSFDRDVNWNTQPDRSPTYNITLVPSEPSIIEWDVTQLLQETLGASGKLDGIAVSGSFEGEYERRFDSMEGERGPRLLVTYVPTADEPESKRPRDLRVALIALGILLITVAVSVWLVAAARRKKAG